MLVTNHGVRIGSRSVIYVLMRFFSLPSSFLRFLGSFDNSVDVLYKNPLVSKHHAAVQFNKKGESFLVDLGSVHGTWKGGQFTVIIIILNIIIHRL